MSSNLVTINMINAYSEEEEEDKAYMDYSQTSEETDLDEGYNADAYAYAEQVAVNAVT